MFIEDLTPLPYKWRQWNVLVEPYLNYLLRRTWPAIAKGLSSASNTSENMSLASLHDCDKYDVWSLQAQLIYSYSNSAG